MTLEEMQVVARIISTADGGCDVCVARLIDEVNNAFPQFHLSLTSDKWKRRPTWADDNEEVDDSDFESFDVIDVKQI